MLLSAPYSPTLGGTYYAAVEVNFPMSAVASAESVQRQAEKAGFMSVSVYEKASPKDWPTARDKGDYFVRATYGRTTSPVIQASQLGGQIVVLKAYQV